MGLIISTDYDSFSYEDGYEQGYKNNYDEDFHRYHKNYAHSESVGLMMPSFTNNFDEGLIDGQYARELENESNRQNISRN